LKEEEEEEEEKGTLKLITWTRFLSFSGISGFFLLFGMVSRDQLSGGFH